MSSPDRRALREFLYVDVARTRSLLAQLQGGIIEEVKEHASSTKGLQGGGHVFGIGAGGSYSHERATEEARSLQDLTFVAFEEVADEAGLILDLGEEFRKPQNWTTGSLHKMLRPSQIVRVTCDIQLLDADHFKQRLSRFELMAKALVKLGTPEQTAGAQNRQQKRSANQSRKRQGLPAIERVQQDARNLASVTGLPMGYLDAIAGFVEAFIGDSIALRVLPCGHDSLEYGFSGALLGREEYIQREREHLFSRYGAKPSEWTAVLQIAALPDPAGTSQPTPPEVVSASGNLQRGLFEKAAVDVLGFMEALGIMEGPRWPSISVTPLGLYRYVPTAPPSHSG